MEEKLQQLRQRLAKAIDVSFAANALSWDQETMMPAGGAAQRADQLSTLSALAHQYFTDEEIGALLEELNSYAESLPYDSNEASLIRINQRDFDRRTKIPVDLVADLAKTTALASEAWKHAKANNDFKHFLPHLERIIALRQRWAACFAPYDNLYNPLLDYFEPGMTQEEIARIFGGLRPELVKMVAAISESAQVVDESVLKRDIDERTQHAFNQAVTAAVGYDYARGRLDVSAHPFTTRISRYDVRITTRFKRDNPIDALMSSIHEAGHGIHHQSLDEALYQSGLDYGPMQSIAESQARFYENIIGRGRVFWRFMYPKLQAAYAPHFDDVSIEAFYRAINRVKPGLIRVEADEVTYGLHIMLRFELEDDLINGRLKAADLPEAWNAKMQDTLGLVPPTDALGVLQDVHWSGGMFGYFPDYLLGSMFSAQLWDAMKHDTPDIEAQFERGEFGAAHTWLHERVMRHGRKFTLPEMADRATGQPLAWEPYLAYLKERYGAIYGV